MKLSPTEIVLRFTARIPGHRELPPARINASSPMARLPHFRGYSVATAGVARILGVTKTITDHLSPTNSRLLTIALSDHLPKECLVPLPCSTKALDAEIEPLPQGHHVVYFPIYARPSDLHPDGTDMDHWPGAPFERRVWAGGEITFHRGWNAKLRLDAGQATCVESVDDVRLSKAVADGKSDNSIKAFVDVRRRYSRLGDEESPAIEERRTLVFMPEATEHIPTIQRSKRVVKGRLCSQPGWN